MSDKLPKGWVKTTLGEIRRDASTGISQKAMLGETFELYSVPSFTEGTPEVVTGDQVGSNKVLVFPGDVLLCKINPRINRAWIVGESKNYRQIASTEWIVFSKQDGILPEFLRLFLTQDKFRDYLAGNVSGVGGSLMRVRPVVVEKFPFALPPFGEQVRLVAKLTALLSQVSRGEAAARRALERLQHYRVAVLHAAVTGELTREWRNTHSPEETGAHLLKRLLAERRVRWEDAEIKRLQVVGKSSKDDKWKNRYPEARPPKADALPDIPPSWAIISIDQLGWKSGYGTSVKCTPDAKGPAVLRIPNIRHGGFDFTDLKFATKANEITEDDFVAPGDFLLIRTNGSMNLIGRGGTAKSELPIKCSFASYLIRFRLVGESTLWSWMSLAWDSDKIRSEIQSRASTTAGQYNVSLSGLADLAIPLPPREEQHAIVYEIERRLAAADRLASTITQQLERARVTRQSLLREAFAGNLVPQDPQEEAANILLERIREAREVEAKEPKVKPMKQSQSKFQKRALIEVLREHKGPMTVEALFNESGFATLLSESDEPQDVVDSFYSELRELTGKPAKISQQREKNQILLRVVS